MTPSTEHPSVAQPDDANGALTRARFLRRGAMAAGALAVAPLVGAAGRAAGATAPGWQTAKKSIDSFRVRPHWQAPGPPFDATKAHGKSIFYLPAAQNSPIIQTFYASFQEAAALVGVNMSTFDAQGVPSEFDRGIQTAIGRKVDCILIEGIQPQLIQTSIEQAHAEGIKAVSVDARDESVAKPFAAIDAVIALPYAQAGRLLADWAIADSRGNVNALLVYPSDILSGVDEANAARDRVKKLCPGCTVAPLGITIPDRPTLGTRMLVELTRHPNLNYILAGFDSLALLMAPQLALAAASGSKTAKRIKLVSFNAVPAAMTFLKEGAIAAEIGSPNTWHAWAQIDTCLRLMTGNPPVKSERVRLRVFDRTNLGPKFDLNAPEETWYGPRLADEFKTGFKKLWGVSG